MAEQKREVEHQISFNHTALLNGLSEPAFRFCVDKLYPLFNYRILKKEDIRRIDLLEQLTILFESIPKTDEGKTRGSCNYYFYIIRKYFNSFMGAVKGDQAEKYQKRIFEIMDLTNHDSLLFDEVEDVLTVFISSIRTLKQANQLDGKRYLFYNCRLDLEVDDADLLESIWKNKNFIPNDIVQKKKRGIATRNKSKDDKEIDFALKFTYINSLLYLARGLDQRGEFGAEE